MREFEKNNLWSTNVVSSAVGQNNIVQSDKVGGDEVACVSPSTDPHDNIFNDDNNNDDVPVLLPKTMANVDLSPNEIQPLSKKIVHVQSHFSSHYDNYNKDINFFACGMLFKIKTLVVDGLKRQKHFTSLTRCY